MERLGEDERVEGILTATESEVDAAEAAVLEVAKEVVELVLSSAAARRGREAGAVPEPALRLMRAASWFREGMRGPGVGRSDLETSLVVVLLATGGVAIYRSSRCGR